MTPSPLPHGLWGVLATPFHGPRLEVDLESLRREVDLYLRVPADGLVVLGVFGEGVALASDEQAAVVSEVAKTAPGTPLVVGVSARTTAVAIEQARTAAGAAGSGLAGVMVQANTTDPGVLAKHLAAVHEATGAGIVLQDYPEASGVRITADQILEVLAASPFVVAVKSEAPPTSAAIGRLTAATGVPVFGGLGGVGLLDELAAGAAGAMTGFSHPEGSARGARRLGGRWLHRRARCLRALAAAGQLRGTAGRRARDPQGDPAPARRLRRLRRATSQPHRPV